MLDEQLLHQANESYVESAGQGDSFNLLGPDESFDNFKQRGTAEFNPFHGQEESKEEDNDEFEYKDSSAQLDV